MKHKLLLAFVVIVLTGLYLSAYRIVGSRYFSKPQQPPENILPNAPQNPDQPANYSDEEPLTPEEKAEIDEELKDEEVEDAPIENDVGDPEDGSYLDITSADCRNGCKNFNENGRLQYCKQVCGLVDTQKRDDCSQLEGLERDYCLKDSAIQKKNISVCAEITDTTVRKSCQNRLMEEVLEKNTI